MADGPVGPLYVGGNFTSAGVVAAKGLARWNGGSWAGLGAGLTQTSGSVHVRDLMLWNDGSGNALYAAGSFSHAAGLASRGVAKWNGTAWSSLGSGVLGASVSRIDHFVDGGVDRLYALTGDLEKFQGGAWSVAAAGVAGTTLEGFAGEIYAGGHFNAIGSMVAHSIVRWNGSVLAPVTRSPGNGLDSQIEAMAVFDDGNGKALWVAGRFQTAGDQLASYVAKWDGRRWWPIPGGDPLAKTLAVYDDGNGAALYMGTALTTSPMSTAGQVKRWNGAGWTTVSTASFPAVSRLVTFDPGTGPLLVAFTFNISGSGISAYDGSTWTHTFTGVRVFEAEASYDRPGDPSLFTATPNAASGELARWDGATWSPLPGITGGTVNALRIFDDGNGPALYAGGSFTTAGGAPGDRLAKWDGTSWSEVGGGLDGTVLDLEVFDDGRGDALYVTGSFETAGGEPFSTLIRWDGANWESVGQGGSEMVRFADAGAEVLYLSGGGSDATPPVNLFAQYCQPYNFADGFESGDAAAWSASTP